MSPGGSCVRSTSVDECEGRHDAGAGMDPRCVRRRRRSSGGRCAHIMSFDECDGPVDVVVGSGRRVVARSAGIDRRRPYPPVDGSVWAAVDGSVWAASVGRWTAHTM